MAELNSWPMSEAAQARWDAALAEWPVVESPLEAQPALEQDNAETALAAALKSKADRVIATGLPKGALPVTEVIGSLGVQAVTLQGQETLPPR